MAGLSVKEVLRGMMSLYDESLAARSLEVEYGLTELTATTRGMHRSMVLEVSLFSDAHNESICDRTVDKSPLHLLLLWEFPDSVYIEPTELQVMYSLLSISLPSFFIISFSRSASFETRKWQGT